MFRGVYPPALRVRGSKAGERYEAPVVSGFGFRVSDFGFRIVGLDCRVPGFEFRVSGIGFRVSRVSPVSAGGGGVEGGREVSELEAPVVGRADDAPPDHVERPAVITQSLFCFCIVIADRYSVFIVVILFLLSLFCGHNTFVMLVPSTHLIIIISLMP